MSGGPVSVEGDNCSLPTELVPEGCVVVVEGRDDRRGGIESALKLGSLSLQVPQLDSELLSACV